MWWDWSGEGSRGGVKDSGFGIWAVNSTINWDSHINPAGGEGEGYGREDHESFEYVHFQGICGIFKFRCQRDRYKYDSDAQEKDVTGNMYLQPSTLFRACKKMEWF